MLFDIMTLASHFRQAGIKVSCSELEDFLTALTHTGLDRESFIYALEATLIKDQSQKSTALRILDFFLADCEKKLPDLKTAHQSVNRKKIGRREFYRRLDFIKSEIRNEKMRLAEELLGCGGTAGGPGGTGRATGGSNTVNLHQVRLADVIAGGSHEELRLAARDVADSIIRDIVVDRPTGQLHKKAQEWTEGEELLQIISGSAGKDIWTAEDRINTFATLVSGEKDRILWKNNREELLKSYDRSSLSFNRMDFDEASEIKRKLVIMGRHLATKRGYRYRAAKRGLVDLRRTAALAGTYGGIPVRLLKKERIPARPEIVILCDLSGSVASFSRFMMLLVSAMHEKFRSVRTFAFVDGIEDITGMLKGWDAEKKISHILRETRIWKTGFSDYGEVWRIFAEKYISCVTGKTTLLILGDARNNYRPEGLDYFKIIAGKAGRTIWLNPYPEKDWNCEDSIFSRYAPYCQSVFECSNLMQLERVARSVFR